MDFLYFDAGGGHRSAAQALEAAIGSYGYPWEVRLVNLQDILDSLDIFQKITGVRLQDLYNRMLAKGWTLGATMYLPVMQWVIRRYHRSSVRLLAEFWGKNRPDMVVSLVPNLNRAAFEALERSYPETPFVTIMTDLADYPPHFWIERQLQHIICGTNQAALQAKHLGYKDWQIHRVTGMILRPVFYKKVEIDRCSRRRELGLDPHLPTALVMFGGEGSNVMFTLAKRLGSSNLPLQLIFICGRNERLQKRLQGLNTRNKILIVGFTSQVPRYMSISDFFIGKPGPGSISEALQMGLPVIVEANAWTLPQERYNTVWLKEHHYGVVLRTLSKIEPTVRSLVESGSIEDYKRRVADFENRALFEIPPILLQILNGNPSPATAPLAMDVWDSGD